MIKIEVGYPDVVFTKTPKGTLFKNISAFEKTKMLFYDLLQSLYMWAVPVISGIALERFQNSPPSIVFFLILGAMPLLFPIRIWAEEDAKTKKIHDSVHA
jgi:hypothetical protein